MNKFSLSALLTLTLTLGLAISGHSKPMQPNIVLILADDLGWNSPACFEEKVSGKGVSVQIYKFFA
jgi:hypothetical protein